MCRKDVVKPFYVPRRYCEARVGLFMRKGRPRKQFPLLWKSCAARASLLMCGKGLITPLYPPRRCCEACLSAREDLDSIFHHCGGPMRLMKACLCAG